MDRVMSDALRKPFPKEQIGKLPATNKRPALDFVGHAAVTDRLRVCAPDWSYTVDEMFTMNGVCWIRGTMTIEGVSRVEYGDGSDPKEAIGNFIRRAAMRWGVALDLWSREDLEPSSAGGSTEPSRTRTPGAGETPAPVEDSPPPSVGVADSPPADGASVTEGGVVGEPGEEAVAASPSGADLELTSPEAHDLYRQFEALCREAEMKPMATFVRVTGSTASWKQLKAGDVPIADIEKAIAAVAEVLLRKADA